MCISITYDHRVWKTGLPVRSAVLKPHAGWLVVGWVTTSESQLLYVFAHPFLHAFLLPLLPGIRCRPKPESSGNGPEWPCMPLNSGGDDVAFLASSVTLTIYF
jgi:hypothetical protein